MLFYADSFDANGIVDQTDLISLPITFVEALDGSTGKRRALEAKINTIAGRAVFNFAFPAMFRFTGILSAAPQTRLFLSQMQMTDCTCHPTWRQHCYGYIRVGFQ